MFKIIKIKCFLLVANKIPTDPLEILQDTSVNGNSELTGILSSVYGILTIVFFAGSIISLMAHAVVTALFKNNPEKWAELKEVVGHKILMVFCASSLTSICAFIKYLADSLIS